MPFGKKLLPYNKNTCCCECKKDGPKYDLQTSSPWLLVICGSVHTITYMNINDITPKNINKIQGEKKSLTYENRTHNTSNKTDGKPLDSRTKAER